MFNRSYEDRTIIKWWQIKHPGQSIQIFTCFFLLWGCERLNFMTLVLMLPCVFTKKKKTPFCRTWLIWLTPRYLSQLLQQLLLTIDQVHMSVTVLTIQPKIIVAGAFIAKRVRPLYEVKEMQLWQSITHHHSSLKYSWTLHLGTHWRKKRSE